MYKVTIAIPVYNVEKYIKDSLLSALNQTYDNIEYIIVDDRGTDKSMDIVKDVLSNHPRGRHVRIITHPQNIGLGGARNTSIENATGNYIYFMDSDDTIEPETIQLLCDSISGIGIDVVEGSYRLLSNEGETIVENVLPYFCIHGRMAICEWMKQNRRYYDGYSWNKLISLKLLRKKHIRCLPSHRNEDVFFSFQVVLYAESIITLPLVTYNYYMRPGSIVHQEVNELYYNQYLEIFDARTKLLREVRVDKPTVLYNYYLQHFFEWWIDYILKGNFSKEKKYLFYRKMQTVFSLNFKRHDLVGIRYKIKYDLLKFSNYNPYVIFSFFDNKCQMLYSMIQKRIKCLPLPYNHL